MRSRSDLEGGTLHSDVHHDTMACAEKKKTYPPKTDTYPTLGKGKASTQKCLYWGGYVGYQEGISNRLSLVVLSKKRDIHTESKRNMEGRRKLRATLG